MSGSSSSRTEDAGEDSARMRFGNAKSISSDQFFNRSENDAESEEKRARLREFQGATSISSSQYFGRDDEDDKALADGNRPYGVNLP